MKNVYKVLGVGYDETYNTKEEALRTAKRWARESVGTDIYILLNNCNYATIRKPHGQNLEVSFYDDSDILVIKSLDMVSIPLK